MLPDRVSNPGPLTYESGALPIALRGQAHAHTSAIVTAFLKKEKVTVFPHPTPAPYSLDLAPCDFFLFPKLKSFLAGRKYQSRHALGSAMHQYLITVPKLLP